MATNGVVFRVSAPIDAFHDTKKINKQGRFNIMKKKIIALLLATIIILSVFTFLSACTENNQKSDKPPVDNNPPSSQDTPPVDNNPPTPQEVVLPTKAEIVSARQNALAETVQKYDYALDLRGDFSILGLGTGLSGKYEGFYRYDTANDDLLFKRTTSGALLYDSTEYIFTSGNTQIKMKMDGNEVKKISVETPEDQNITMINLPVVAIVDSLKEGNISNIKALKNSQYAYSCSVQLENSNVVFKTLNKVFEKLGSGVSFNGITVSTNVSTLDFNIKNNKLNDFKLAFQMIIGVKNVNVALTVIYTQNDTTRNFVIPNVSGDFVYKTNDIQRELTTIESALENLKNDDAYSLDLTAENKFDPGWNKLSINDSYTAKMFKNTVDDTAWFNHSYCYKAHSEKDGKESYKYTLGNVNGKDDENQGTWLISRKSSNTQTKVDNVTADTQFDFLTSILKLKTTDIDCIKKITSGSETIYTLQLGRNGADTIQSKIVSMINTNKYDDEVIEVNNYFNTNNIIKNAEIKIVIKDGKIASATCDTKLCYTPVGGEYDEFNITLNNTVELIVNKDLDKAQKYSAPTKVKGTLSWGKNLNDHEYYIL